MSSDIISCLKLFDFKAFLRLDGQFRYRKCFNPILTNFIFYKAARKEDKKKSGISYACSNVSTHKEYTVICYVPCIFLFIISDMHVPCIFISSYI